MFVLLRYLISRLQHLTSSDTMETECLERGLYAINESPKNWGYYKHVQTVRTRPLLGGEGPGDEACGLLTMSHGVMAYEQGSSL